MDSAPVGLTVETLASGHYCQATEKGVAFSPAITLTGEAVDENLSIKKTNILYIVKTIKEITNSYNEKMSSILTPESNIELVK